jgi:preprotein translocase subunit SecD
MLKVIAHMILAGLLPVGAAQAQDSGRPVRRVSLLYQMDTTQIRNIWLRSLQVEARRALSEAKIAHKGVLIVDNRVQVNLRDVRQMDVALPRLKKLTAPLPGILLDGMFSQTPGFDLTITAGENGVIVIEPTVTGLENRIANALTRTAEIVRMRADQDGTGGATAEAQEPDRILIEVPEPATSEVKARVGVTAKLTFQLVDLSFPVERARAEGPPPDDLFLPESNNPARSVLVSKVVMLSGDDLVDAQASLDERSGEPAVAFEFNAKGTAALAYVSRENIGKPFAIVLDDKVISTPVIVQEILSGRGIINGNFSLAETTRLALLLRSGALPAALTLIEERSREP